MRKEIHIVPNSKKGGWDVEKPELSRVSRHFGNKKDAESYARSVAKDEHREMIPHRKDGTIQNPSSFGNDPCPPKDKN